MRCQKAAATIAGIQHYVEAFERGVIVLGVVYALLDDIAQVLVIHRHEIHLQDKRPDLLIHTISSHNGAL